MCLPKKKLARSKLRFEKKKKKKKKKCQKFLGHDIQIWQIIVWQINNLNVCSLPSQNTKIRTS